MTSLSSASPPPSPTFARVFHIPSHSMPLSVSSVANIFVKMRRHHAKTKAHHIDSTSGEEPQTHPSLAGEGVVSVRKVPLSREDHFVCRDAVDVTKLLRAVRGALYEKAEALGANVLVDEQWSCTVCGPRHRSDGSFRVYIRYSASAARSDKPDPQRPVALEKARGVPGLMTILSRQE